MPPAGYANANAPKPHTLDYIHAAAVPSAARTAWQALFDTADLHSGQTLLIHCGAGGVGGYAIQLAKLNGARVIATAVAAHLDYIKNLGADLVIDYHAQPFEQQVKDVALVLVGGASRNETLVGGETQARSWQVIRHGGILVSTVGVSVAGIPQVIRAIGMALNPKAERQLQNIEIDRAKQLLVDLHLIYLSQQATIAALTTQDAFNELN